MNSNMLQGTRFGDSIFQLDPGPHADFFRAQYLRDFVNANPPVFVDSVGPRSVTYTDRDRDGHERFEELAAIVRTRYSLVAEIDSARVYVRNDRIHNLEADVAS